MFWLIVLLCGVIGNGNLHGPSATTCLVPHNAEIVRMQRFKTEADCKWYLDSIQPWPSPKDTNLIVECGENERSFQMPQPEP